MTTGTYGAGLERPARATGAGRLALTGGEERVWESVAEILATPLGSCPLDPTFGAAIELLDPVSNVERLAWAVGQAIESCEPRVRDVYVNVLPDAGGTDGDVAMQIGLVLNDGRTRLNRIFPFYRKV
jgi:phage baseplate assembly protein W